MNNNVAPIGPNLPGQNVINALLQLIQTQLPGLGVGAVLTAQLLTQVVNIIRNNLSRIMGTVLTAGGLAALLPSLALVVVNALGFTSSGVLYGSFAAWFQSVIYGGATGGIFSGLQSFGATAAIAHPAVLVLGGLALGAGAAFFWWRGSSIWGNIWGSIWGNSGDDDDDDDPADQGPGNPPHGPGNPPQGPSNLLQGPGNPHQGPGGPPGGGMVQLKRG